VTADPAVAASFAGAVQAAQAELKKLEDMSAPWRPDQGDTPYMAALVAASGLGDPAQRSVLNELYGDVMASVHPVGTGHAERLTGLIWKPEEDPEVASERARLDSAREAPDDQTYGDDPECAYTAGSCNSRPCRCVE